MNVGAKLTTLTGKELACFVLHVRKNTALYDVLILEETKDPTVKEWGLNEQLLAGLCDAVNLLTWGLCGGDSKQPPPIPRPGITKDETSNNIKQYKGVKVTLQQAKERLAKTTITGE